MGKKNTFHNFSDDENTEDNNGLSSLDAFGKVPEEMEHDDSEPVRRPIKKSRR